MTLFELIEKISAILTPETNSFYDDVLRFAEDGGGDLRIFPSGGEPSGQYPIQDREIEPVERAVVAFRRPIQEGGVNPFRLFYRYDGFWSVDHCVLWSVKHRLPAVYVCDLGTMTCRHLDINVPMFTGRYQPAMTLYELIGKISAILTPETNSFYDYVLRSTDDDGGFLRTRWCLWGAPGFWNREIPWVEEAIVCFRAPFQEDYGSGTDRVQLQLFYEYLRGHDHEFCVSWSRNLGYGVPYLFDFRTMTYKILEN